MFRRYLRLDEESWQKITVLGIKCQGTENTYLFIKLDLNENCDM